MAIEQSKTKGRGSCLVIPIEEWHAPRDPPEALAVYPLVEVLVRPPLLIGFLCFLDPESIPYHTVPLDPV
jgi:hypothetical protein